ncbi:hypothetical protein DDB_G0283141 [Dictyostelium discoideum AX4]|uniref:Uncharacterized protein n=1 Tax=Dictyostelium discoideum TaxID=44689 RepID=Q54RK0_DICDI|nr:hypothetical protein DDB_G0283141 [Dictyostelium discoideum AX4]EAL65900.1 hypothetical protein DDB_G0283141 [Dictyostelium discoideum AX4]|eukprot:XP_639236.1 hypothetical protein DDB_G0283141 [Dictyostelium discoideum AX4]
MGDSDELTELTKLGEYRNRSTSNNNNINNNNNTTNNTTNININNSNSSTNNQFNKFIKFKFLIVDTVRIRKKPQTTIAEILVFEKLLESFNEQIELIEF